MVMYLCGAKVFIIELLWCLAVVTVEIGTTIAISSCYQNTNESL